MEKIIEIPDGINVDVAGNKITAKGPKGTVSRDFSDPRFAKSVEIKKIDKTINVSCEKERRKMGAVVGTTAAHIKNMITGVQKGYNYKMKIHYVHFPITLEAKGRDVVVKNFLGERGLRKASIVGSVKVEIKKDDVFVTGVDIEEVGQTAANIESACKISGRDKRIYLDGIYIIGKHAAE